eukprot:3387822-Prymnesium_polylepis.1
MIARWRASSCEADPAPPSASITDGRIAVVVRKRPLLPDEVKAQPSHTRPPELHARAVHQALSAESHPPR